MRIVQKLKRSNFASEEYSQWMKTNIVFVYFTTLLSAIGAAFYTFQLFTFDFVLLISLPALIAILYPISFKMASSSFTSLRSIPGLKLFLISFSWAYITYFIPKSLASDWFWQDNLAFIARMLLISALVIPFDIRDLKVDDKSLSTIPQKLGITTALEFSKAAVVVNQLWYVIMLLFFDLDFYLMCSYLVGLEIVYILIKRMDLSKSNLYVSFWIEAMPIYSVLLFLTLKLLSPLWT